MSELTDALRDKDDDEFKTFLLDRLSQAEAKVEPFAMITSKEKYPVCVYWQGQKDALRAIVAAYLQEPMMATLSDSNELSLSMRMDFLKDIGNPKDGQ